MPMRTDFRWIKRLGKLFHMRTSHDLLPPVELLFDGSSTIQEFISVGDGFTREYLLHRAHLQPNERVLDLGSGNGQKARVLATYLDSRGSYEGLDIVRAGIEWCQLAYPHLPNFRFILADDLHSTHYNPKGRVRAENYRLP